MGLGSDSERHNQQRLFILQVDDPGPGLIPSLHLPALWVTARPRAIYYAAEQEEKAPSYNSQLINTTFLSCYRRREAAAASRGSATSRRSAHTIPSRHPAHTIPSRRPAHTIRWRTKATADNPTPLIPSKALSPEKASLRVSNGLRTISTGKTRVRSAQS